MEASSLAGWASVVAADHYLDLTEAAKTITVVNHFWSGREDAILLRGLLSRSEVFEGWCDQVRWLRSLARRFHKAKVRKPEMPADEADNLLSKVVCRFKPPLLVHPTGRPGFRPDVKRTEDVAGRFGGEWFWEGLGLSPSPNPGEREYGRWWAVAIGTLFIPVRGICPACGEDMPPSKTGRKPRRSSCQKCQNKKYYQKWAARDREHARAVWVADKRRQRKPKN
ncbi:MAG: hypothetical protein JWO38_3519 [Gemmataceae bacterium]|nr:hypothetical protein [Gemmataceae bacterium]